MEFHEKVTHVYLIGERSSAISKIIRNENIPFSRLVVAHEQSQYADFRQLKESLSRSGVKIDSWILPTTPSTDEVLQSFFELFNYEKDECGDILLNATCGARHQVLAAYEAARSYELPIYIVEPERESICWLYPEEYPEINLLNKISYFTPPTLRAVI